MNRVWPGRVVEDNSLHAHVSALRRALRDERGSIRTVSGRGYQFTAEVQRGEARGRRAAGGARADQPARAGGRADRARGHRRRRARAADASPPADAGRHRRHRQDAARPRGGARGAGAPSRRRVARRAGAARRRRADRRHGGACARRDADDRAGLEPGARHRGARPLAAARARQLRAPDRARPPISPRTCCTPAPASPSWRPAASR